LSDADKSAEFLKFSEASICHCEERSNEAIS